MCVNTYITNNYTPWRIKVREQLCEKAIQLHEMDTTRRGEKSFVGEPSLVNFCYCNSNDGERHFCIASSSNLFYHLIMEEDWSRRLVRDNPEMFGTKDARDVILALRQYLHIDTENDFEHFCEIMKHEQYAWIVEYDENGIVGDKILRLDLYRKLEEGENGEYDFTGGLMHVFKHFSCYGRPLSYQKSNNEVPSLSYIIRMIIEAFFMEDLILEERENKKAYVSAINYNSKIMKAIFFYNKEAGVYFINSFHE